MMCSFESVSTACSRQKASRQWALCPIWNTTIVLPLDSLYTARIVSGGVRMESPGLEHLLEHRWGCIALLPAAHGRVYGVTTNHGPKRLFQSCFASVSTRTATHGPNERPRSSAEGLL